MRSYKSKKRSYKSKKRSYKRKNSYIKKSKLRSKKRIYKKSKVRGGNGKTGRVSYDVYNAASVDDFMKYAKEGEEIAKLRGDKKKLYQMFPQEEFQQKFVKSPENYNKDGSLRLNEKAKGKGYSFNKHSDYLRKARQFEQMKLRENKEEEERIKDEREKLQKLQGYKGNDDNENGYTYEEFGGDPSQY